MGRITSSRTQLKPDPVYNSVLASKFVNCLMWDGKKSDGAARLLRRFGGAAEAGSGPGADRRLHAGGGERQAAHRGAFQACRWCRLPGADAGEPQPAAVAGLSLDPDGGARKEGATDPQKLADELLAAYKKEGAAITRRENVHRMADANKAFAHFAW